MAETSTASSIISTNPAEPLPPLVTQEQRHHRIMQGPYQPRALKFPVTEAGGQKRSFNQKWYDLPYSKEWLEYSPTTDCMYCFACRMFGVPGADK